MRLSSYFKTISRMSAFGRLQPISSAQRKPAIDPKRTFKTDMKTNMKIIQAFLITLTLSLCSGCLILPLPATSQSMDTFKEKSMDISEGSTTREEVISIIGKPDIKLKKFILYKRKVQSGGSRILYWFGIPVTGRGITFAAGSKRIQGDMMDVFFEFDEQGILTEYRFIEYDDPYYRGAAKCYSVARSNYYCCLSLTEEKNTPISQCEETLETSLEPCHLLEKLYAEIENLNIGKDCDPGIENCTMSGEASLEEVKKNLEDVKRNYYESKIFKSNSHLCKEEGKIVKVKKEEILEKVVEVPCVWQFDSCMQWAGNPQQEKQCNKDKEMCLQKYQPCNTGYSSCLSKVGRAISSESYCVKEKQKCFTNNGVWSILK